jgi:hypothetical protein
MLTTNTSQSSSPNAQEAVPVQDSPSKSPSSSDQHPDAAEQSKPVPITTEFGRCPRCRVRDFTGICFECGYNTGRDLSIQEPAPSPSPRTYSTNPHSPPITTLASKCPRCNAKGFTGQCFKCGYNTGIGLPNSKSCSDSLYQSHTTKPCCSPATVLAKTCPRCGAGGFTGQCFECGYNTCIFLRVKS